MTKELIMEKLIDAKNHTEWNDACGLARKYAATLPADQQDMGTPDPKGDPVEPYPIWWRTDVIKSGLAAKKHAEFKGK